MRSGRSGVTSLAGPCGAGRPLPLLVPGSSVPISTGPQSALRGKGARPQAALLFWLRGGSAAPRPEKGELSPSVWISLLAIATAASGQKCALPGQWPGLLLLAPVFLPRIAARACLGAQRLSGSVAGNAPAPTPLGSLAVSPEVRPGLRDAAASSPYPG